MDREAAQLIHAYKIGKLFEYYHEEYASEEFAIKENYMSMIGIILGIVMQAFKERNAE